RPSAQGCSGPAAAGRGAALRRDAAAGAVPRDLVAPGGRGPGRRIGGALRVGHRCPGAALRADGVRRELAQHLEAQPLAQIGVLEQELPRTLAALPEPLLAVAQPGAGAPQHAAVDAEVEQLADLVDAAVEQDVELDLAERRRDLVLDDRGLRTRTDRRVPALERADPPDVDPHRRI